MTVFVAIIRYIVISRTTRNGAFTLKHSRLAVAVSIAVSVVYSVPYWLMLNVATYVDEETGHMCYQLAFNNVMSSDVTIPMYFFYDTIVGILLACFCVLIIHRLRKLNELCRIMTRDMAARVKRQTRTTMMLLALLVTSLTTTLVPFVLLLIPVFFDEEYMTEAMVNLIMLMYLMNNSINFWFYMVSEKFRQTFLSMFLRMKINRSEGNKNEVNATPRHCQNQE